MKESPPPSHGWRFDMLSGPAMILITPLLAALLVLPASYFLLNGARDQDRGKLEIVLDRLRDGLAQNGVAGAVGDIEDIEATWDQDKDRLSAMLSITDGAVEVTEEEWDFGALERWTEFSGRGDAIYALPDGRRFLVAEAGGPDDKRLRDAKVPITNAILRVALEIPGSHEQAIRNVLFPIWAGYGLLLFLSLLLFVHVTRRYRRGLEIVTADMVRFADGETDRRVMDPSLVPELRRLADRVNPQLARLERLISGIRDFGFHAKHEIGNPLANARRSLERTASDPESAIADADGHIRTAILNLSSIVQLLKLDPDAAHASAVVRSDLGDIVTSMLETMNARLSGQSRQLQADVAESVIVAADRDHLNMMVQNLFENVDKYAGQDAPIRISLTTREDRFRLAVSNTPAFPADVRDVAFQPFTRSARDHDKPGMGIGLSFVERIAARYGFSASITPSDEVAEVVIEGLCARDRPASEPNARRRR